MAADDATLVARWPHFAKAPVATRTAALDAAKLRVRATLAGDRWEEAVLTLAAHTIALDPGGQMSRLVDKKGQTTYGKAFERLMSEIAVPDRVL